MRGAVAVAFARWPALAYFEFAPATGGEAVARVVDDAVKLAGAKYAVEAGEVAEKTGYAVT